MAKHKAKGLQKHRFRDKLVLNHWLISLFGIDPLVEQKLGGKVVRPFHRLAAPIRDTRMEGLDADNIHKFYHNLVSSELFWNTWYRRQRPGRHQCLSLSGIYRNLSAGTGRANRNGSAPGWRD